MSDFRTWIMQITYKIRKVKDVYDQVLKEVTYKLVDKKY